MTTITPTARTITARARGNVAELRRHPPVGVDQAPQRALHRVVVRHHRRLSLGMALLMSFTLTASAAGTQRPRPTAHQHRPPGIDVRRLLRPADRRRAGSAHHQRRVRHRHDPVHPHGSAESPPGPRRQGARPLRRRRSSLAWSARSAPARLALPIPTPRASSLTSPTARSSTSPAALYLALVAVFALGLGTILRSSAGGIAAALGTPAAPDHLVIAGLTPAEWATDLMPYLLSNAGTGMFPWRFNADRAGRVAEPPRRRRLGRRGNRRRRAADQTPGRVES